MEQVNNICENYINKVFIVAFVNNKNNSHKLLMQDYNQ